jgi:Protein of unknown function (DUF4058)
MRPPFPGMDPWLEGFRLWPNVHNSLIGAIRDELVPILRPRYFVDIESRTTVLTASDEDHLYSPDVAIYASDMDVSMSEGVALMERVATQPYHIVVPLPADEIEETFLTIKELPGHRVVTTIEVLSPTNKKTEDARKAYLATRRELLKSSVNFVEIDLLRAGKQMPPEGPRRPSDYRILVFRPRLGMFADLYGFSYKMEIPPIPIPLLPQDEEPSLDLNRVLHMLYEKAGYDLAIDYRQPPQPHLRKQDEAWAAKIIGQALPGTHAIPAERETSP